MLTTKVYNVEQSSKRYFWIDFLKGLAILMVIMGHCIGSDYPRVVNVINSFHMPLFFFASGLVYRKVDIEACIMKKIKSLLLPLIICEFLNFWPKLLFHFIETDYNEYLLNVFQFRGQWFLIVLFIVQVFFCIMDNHFRLSSKGVSFCVISFVLGGVGLWLSELNLDFIENYLVTALVASPFYCVGVVFGRKIQSMSAYTERKRIYIGFYGGIALCLMILLCSNQNINMYRNDFGNVLTFIPKAFLGICCMTLFSISINRNKLFEFWGSNSMIIMLVHFPIYIGLNYIYRFLNEPVPILFWKVMLIIITLSISSVVAKVLCKNFPAICGKMK